MKLPPSSVEHRFENILLYYAEVLVSDYRLSIIEVYTTLIQGSGGYDLPALVSPFSSTIDCTPVQEP
jgi:hypothetical protein